MSLNVCFLQVLPEGVVLRNCDSDGDCWGVGRVWEERDQPGVPPGAPEHVPDSAVAQLAENAAE